MIVSKRGTGDEVAVIDAAGTRRVLALASIASLARPAVSHDGRRVAVPLPVLSSTAWALQLMDVSGGPLTEIVSGGGHPIMPAWSPDGQHVYFARADDQGVFGLWRVGAGGGVAQPVVPPPGTGRRRPRSSRCGHDRQRPNGPVAARVARDRRQTGTRAFADRASVVARRSERRRLHLFVGQRLEFEIPAGEYHIEATRGFEHLPAREDPHVRARVRRAAVSLVLRPLGGRDRSRTGTRAITTSI